MRLGRFIVDTHVHAQRFAAGPRLGGSTRYQDLASVMREMEAYDNSARLLYDMERYGVDMCVLLPGFGMSNELNAQLVERYPEKFVACCGAVETAKAVLRGEMEWSAEAAAQELDRLLSTGKFVGIGEGIPYDPRRRRSVSLTERLDQIRVILEVARKHRVPARIHTGVVQGYPLTHHIFPESLEVLWLTDIAAEFPDVPLILDHGGMQAGYLERWVEEALHVAGSHDNVFLETGLWWAELYEKALADPNVGPEKLLWGTDWGASMPVYWRPGPHPRSFAQQVRRWGIPRHQVDFWGWSFRQLLRLDISQDDLNLILGGNAVRVFRLWDRVPVRRLFRPVEGPWGEEG